jgi:subtilisin family serine protease
MSTLWVRIVDADFRLIENATVRAVAAEQQPIELQIEEDRWVGHSAPGAQVTIHVSAEGFETETHAVVLREEVTQVVIGLRQPGQLSYSYGNDRLAFSPVEDAFLIRVRGADAADIFSKVAKEQELKWQPVSPRAESATDDLFLRVDGNTAKAHGLSEELTRNKLDVEISLIIGHDDRPPLGLTNEVVVRFHDDIKRREADRLAAGVELKITRQILHAGNTFVLARDGDPSYALLKAADTLSQSSRVIYVEPNLTFVAESDLYTPNDPLWAEVPHLKLIDVDDAWDLLDDVVVNLRGGSPDITIAIIDLDGVTPNHPDLTANLTDGTSKLVSSTNFAGPSVVAQTVAGLGGDHGTKCAASATAAFDENRGLPGVAPNCHLIGARIAGSAVKTVEMPDIYMWVAGFQTNSPKPGFPAAPPARAADVISSSWGWNGLPLSNVIRDCFDFLTTYGRGGKGCVLCFSIGDPGYHDFTNAAGSRFRAWPTYDKTLGVGSSINVNPTSPLLSSLHADPNGNTTNIATTVDTRALYSPYGQMALRKPDLVAPSNTGYGNSLTQRVDPILSAVRVGTGTVDGCPSVAVCKDYAKSFGGTSHSTPTVAGAVALILSARPGLSWEQVREILRQSSVRIDARQTDAIGQWQDLDGDNLIDYSPWYGAGRLNVYDAVKIALDNSLYLADDYSEELANIGDEPLGVA